MNSENKYHRKADVNKEELRKLAELKEYNPPPKHKRETNITPKKKKRKQN